MRTAFPPAGRLCAVLAGAVASLAAAASAATAGSPLKPGVFLYASPALGDPNFVEAVVLLVAHDEEGSMGLVINRPTNVPLGHAVKDLGERPLPDLLLHRGGPVQRDLLVALVRSADRIAGARQVLPDVYFAPEAAQWKPVTGKHDAASRLRVYAGYAGWSAGQLAAELRHELWFVGPADAASVFSADPSALWPRVRQIMRSLQARGDGDAPVGAAR